MTSTKTPEFGHQWLCLFDGTSMNSWKEYRKNDLRNAWNIVDHELSLQPDTSQEAVNHDIVTKRTFTNFELSVEWRISEGGNSGVFWGVQETDSCPYTFFSGPEIQIIDNSKHPDVTISPKRQCAALYDILAPSHQKTGPAGDWNHYLLNINYRDNRGTLHVNGTQVLHFPLKGPAWEKLIAPSKLRDPKNNNYFNAPLFGTQSTGKIALQDHGDEVSFRNIYIRPL